jgi:hypothetical protein
MDISRFLLVNPLVYAWDVGIFGSTAWNTHGHQTGSDFSHRRVAPWDSALGSGLAPVSIRNGRHRGLKTRREGCQLTSIPETTTKVVSNY